MRSAGGRVAVVLAVATLAAVAATSGPSAAAASDRVAGQEPIGDAEAAAGTSDGRRTPKAAPAPDAAAPIADRYIVRFAPGADPAAEASSLGREVQVRHVYRHGFAGAALQVPERAVAALRRHPRIVSIEPDLAIGLPPPVPAGSAGTVGPAATQPNAIWGLDRLDQRALPLSGSYTYPRDGAGVTVYVVDTGVRASHSDLGGRVATGWSAINDGRGTGDCDGHGTHVAGTIAGATHGVGKAVTLRPVRVLDCWGGGSLSDILAGLDWIVDHHQPGEPAVANLSLGGPPNQSFDDKVQAVIADGVVVVAASGNDGIPACLSSPGRVPDAVTVAATAADDVRPWWANHGSCVDVFAPGVDVRSAGHTSNTATATYSGTSMAAPHVAGVAALLLHADPALDPADVAAAIDADATVGIVGSAARQSPNRLLHAPPTGVAEPQPPPPAPPVNDHFADATVFAPTHLGSVTGSNLFATGEPGEPNHAGHLGGSSVWWRFTATETRTVALGTAGSDIDTMLAVYTGSSPSALTKVAANRNHGPSIHSLVSFTAVAGTTYHVAVDGYDGEEGTILLRQAFPPPGNDHFAQATTFSITGTSALRGANVGATAQTGEPSHAGQRARRSTWWTFTPGAYGTVTLTTRGSTIDTVLAVYTGTSVSGLTQIAANDDHDGLTSRVRFRVRAGTAYRVAVDGYGGEQGWITLTRSFEPATAPKAPTSIGTTAGDTKARVTWAKPADGGAALVEYRARCVPRDTSLRTRTATTTSTSVWVGSLVNGRTYDCQARARNGVGWGPWSSKKAVKPIGPPSAPTSLNHRPGDRRVALSWAVPTSNGGSAILDYHARCVPASSKYSTRTATTTSRSVTVTGLVNGADYRCSVRARNAAGHGSWAQTPTFRPRA